MNKSKKNIFICSFLIIVLFISSILLYEEINTYKALKIDDIEYIAILPGPLGLDPLKFDLNNIEHRNIVEKILNKLKSGQILKPSEKKYKAYFTHGNLHPELIIILKDGRFINMCSIVGYKIDEKSGIADSIPSEIEGQVSVGGDYLREPIRMYSPELKKFMVSDWKNIFAFTLSI